MLIGTNVCVPVVFGWEETQLLLLFNIARNGNSVMDLD